MLIPSLILRIYIQIRKDFDKSKELLNKALDIEPNSKLAKIHLASLSLYDGKVDKALKDLSALEEEKIEDVSVFINLGNAHLESGQYVKAMQSYKKHSILSQESQKLF